MEIILDMRKEKAIVSFAWENWGVFSKEVVTDLDPNGS